MKWILHHLTIALYDTFGNLSPHRNVILSEIYYRILAEETLRSRVG